MALFDSVYEVGVKGRKTTMRLSVRSETRP